jgi:hypothetical protein
MNDGEMARNVECIYWMAVVGVTGIGVILILKILIYLRVMNSQERIEALSVRNEELAVRNEKLSEEMAELLKLIKEYAFSGSNRYKDAAAHHEGAAQKLEQVAQFETTQPTRAEVMDAVQQIPDRTADKVADKFKSGDSGVTKRDDGGGPLPGVLP